MFFTAILVLFFSQTVGVASLRCMTDGKTLTSADCTLTLTTADAIPNDSDLLSSSSFECAMKDATLILLSFVSCYAEVTINYQTKGMVVKLVGVTSASSSLSPYDDMMVGTDGIRSVVQYKIMGNLEKDEVEMTTRVQCETADNCALERLRTLLPNLIQPNARLTIFKQVVDLLNTRDASHGAGLKCQTDGAGKIDQCSEPPEARCKFEQLKDTSRTQECTAYDQSLKYDVEQRHSVIEEAVANGLNKTDKAFKVMYLCKKNSCNDDSHTKGVTHLLRAFAQPSNHPDPANKNVPNLIPAVTPTAQEKKNGKSAAALHNPSIGLLLFLLNVF